MEGCFRWKGVFDGVFFKWKGVLNERVFRLRGVLKSLDGVLF